MWLGILWYGKMVPNVLCTYMNIDQYRQIDLTCNPYSWHFQCNSFIFLPKRLVIMTLFPANYTQKIDNVTYMITRMCSNTYVFIQLFIWISFTINLSGATREVIALIVLGAHILFFIDVIIISLFRMITSWPFDSHSLSTLIITHSWLSYVKWHFWQNSQAVI